RDSQITELLTTAPASMVLKGYTFTPAETYASGSITHSSPTTAVSSMRARRITSVFLPTTQPRSVVPWPTNTRLCTTARWMKAPSVTTTFAPITLYSRTCAPASIFAYSPTATGPVSTASGSTSAPSATHTPGESSNPAMSTSTLRLSTSAWALRYD